MKDIADVMADRKKNTLSLNLTDRKKERDAKEALLKSREEPNGDKNSDKNAKDKNLATQDDGLQSNERNITADLAIEKARKNNKDILLTEAANILSDELGLLKTYPTISSVNKN